MAYVCLAVWIVLLMFRFRDAKDFCSWREYLAFKGMSGLKSILYTYFFWPIAIIIALKKNK